MGNIILESDYMPELLPMEDRTPGLHVSSIIKDLCFKLGYLEDDGKQRSEAYLRLGNAFEFALVEMTAREHPDRYMQIGELELDNIFMTPDLIETREHVVEEIKVTWMSTRGEPDHQKFWRYWTQIKAYCMAMETRIGRLKVCHVNGFYEWVKGGEPRYRSWRQEFSRIELQRNWDMLRRHGERHRERLEEGRTT